MYVGPGGNLNHLGFAHLCLSHWQFCGIDLYWTNIRAEHAEVSIRCCKRVIQSMDTSKDKEEIVLSVLPIKSNKTHASDT